MAQGWLEEVSTDEFLLSETLSNIGSETRQAEIMRKKRADKSNDVTQLLPNVTKCYTEIEKEIEKEIDIELEKEQEIETEIDLETEKKKPKVAKAPIVFYPNDELLNQAFKDYIDMRKKIKATMTDRAIQMSINKLDELSQGDNDKAIKILEQSIMNSWKGLFALKEEKPASKSVDWDNV